MLAPYPVVLDEPASGPLAAAAFVAVAGRGGPRTEPVTAKWIGGVEVGRADVVVGDDPPRRDRTSRVSSQVLDPGSSADVRHVCGGGSYVRHRFLLCGS